MRGATILKLPAGTMIPLLAAAPALGALLVSVAILVLVEIGGRARWLDNDSTLAEAALIGDVGRVYRLLDRGQLPTAAYTIRSRYRSKTKARTLTPVEAAVIGDNTAPLILLLEHGAADTPEARTALLCMARKSDSRAVESWLEEQSVGTDSNLNCP